MEKENKAGQPAGTTAAGDEGNKSVTSPDSQKIADLEAKLAKSESDKEVYRAGMLSMKERKQKKLAPEDITDPEKLSKFIEDKADEKAQERELTDKATAEAERRLKLEKENEELRRALEAKAAAGSTVGFGSSPANAPEVKPQGYLSEERKTELRDIYRTRGFYSDAEIDTMVKRAEELMSTHRATVAMTNPGKTRTH